MPSNSEEYYKKWYAENKDKHKAYVNEDLLCELCNKTIKRCNMKKHKVSSKHLLNEEKAKVSNLINIVEDKTNKLEEIKNVINNQNTLI